jgi:hypothetical protein
MRAQRRYAEKTNVPTDRSRAEIEKLVRRRGATSFGHLTTERGTSIVFEVKNRRIRFDLPIPKSVSPVEERRRWRCLVLNVKAKFEAVESGIVTFDEEFLAHIVVPGTADTVGKRAAPQVARPPTSAG